MLPSPTFSNPWPNSGKTAGQQMVYVYLTMPHPTPSYCSTAALPKPHQCPPHSTTTHCPATTPQHCLENEGNNMGIGCTSQQRLIRVSGMLIQACKDMRNPACIVRTLL